MGLLGKIGKWLWNGVKSTASSVGIDTSSYENDEAQKFQANQSQMNRDWQESMLQKQFDFQADMWNKTNKYNSASEQMKRYRDAGLNPYLMMTGGANAGTATSQGSPSAPSAPSPSGGFANTHPGSASSFIDALSQKRLNLQQEELFQKQIDNWEIRNSLERTRLTEEILGMQKDNRTKDINNYWLDDLNYSAYKKNMSESYLNDARTKVEAQTKIYQKIVNAHLPQQLKANLAVTVAEELLKRNFSVTEGYKQMDYLQGVIESTAKEENITLTNKQIKATAQDIIDMYNSDAWWRGAQNFGNVFGNILMPAAVGANAARGFYIPKPNQVRGFHR